ncbi:hypothetical protein QJQ45_028824, partial [Haematococcus lacustris]
ELSNKLGVVVAEAETARKELEQLRPLQARIRELEHKVEDLSDKLDFTASSLRAAKEDIVTLQDQQQFYKTEIERLLVSNTGLMDHVRDLSMVQEELEEARSQCRDLEAQLKAAQRKLDAALDAQADTLQQLEISRAFLRGMNLVHQGSFSSTASQPARLRPHSAASQETLPDWRPATAPVFAARPGSVPVAGERGRSRPGSAAAAANAAGGAGGSGGGGLPELSPPGMGPLSSTLGPAGASNSTALMAAVLANRGRPRPDSAVSIVSHASSLYGEGTPQEVASLLDARGVPERLQATNLKWLKFKVQLLSLFANRLRKKLLAEREYSASLELRLAQVELAALQAAVAREQEISSQLMEGMRGHLERSKHDVVEELRVVLLQLPTLRKHLEFLAATSTAIGLGLRRMQSQTEYRSDASTQTGLALEHEWAAFLQSLPLRSPPLQPLTAQALADAIARIMLRTLPSVKKEPAWGEARQDTVYDAIMAHYTSQVAPGAFASGYVQVRILPAVSRFKTITRCDVEGPVARLLRCVAGAAETNTRAALFAYLTGVHPSGTPAWPPATWHFLIHVLFALQQLLGGIWKSVCKAWTSSPHGAAVPIQAVYDLVGNLYSVQVPTDLDAPIARRLASIVTPSSAGPVVDLDVLLLLLITEFNTEQCPRSALLFPRRLTDGALFNIFNTEGFSKGTGSLLEGRAGALLSSAKSGAGRGPGMDGMLSQAQNPPGMRPGTDGAPVPRTPVSTPLNMEGQKKRSGNPSAAVVTPPFVTGSGARGLGLSSAAGVPVPSLPPGSNGASHHLVTIEKY